MPSDRVRFIFVYGSLLSTASGGVGADERKLLREQCELVATTSLRGRMFDVGPYPGVTLGGDTRDRVHGEIWRLPPDRTHLFSTLDRYEGCSPACAHPHPYARHKVGVRKANGRRVVAWIYLWNQSTDGLRRIPEGRWRTVGARPAPPPPPAKQAA